ncbi:hypothetical protein ACQ86G_21475 [Roseateles chitinivorans]|uniref:hypothetical protein n=1 Tax=Roseateles chitinivorans TaxID=2917965 RepID=UPI003D67601D
MDAQRLEALGGLVDDADAAAGPTPEQAQQQAEQIAVEAAADQGAREWGMLAYTIGNALAMFAPELKHVYTEDACLAWGRSVVPVADKYGWSGTSKVPELGMALATISLAAPTVIVIRHRLQNPDKDKGGMLTQLKDWWRNKRAKKASEIVRDATDKAAEGMAHDG